MKRFLSVALVVLLSVSFLFAGGSKEAAVQDDGPVRMEWLVGQTSAEVDDNAEVVKMIEERFNIDLKAWYVDAAHFWENLNVRFAGGEMPDVLVIDSTSMLAQLVDGGVVAELPIETIREKAPNYAAYCDANDVNGDLWTTMLYNGKNYGIANPMEQVPMAVIWRKDWLDNLGLEVPTTLEEFEAVLTAFVEQDPDGDGKADTAGMAERTFNAIFGAYGLRCVTGAAPGFKVEEMQLGEDGVPFFPYIRPEAKDVLALLHDWYERGLIDKEFITGENHGGYQWLSHAFMNGQIGVTCAQPYHYLVASTNTQDPGNWGVCMKEFKALNPDGDIVYGPAPIGPDGRSSLCSTRITAIQTTLVLLTMVSKASTSRPLTMAMSVSWKVQSFVRKAFSRLISAAPRISRRMSMRPRRSSAMRSRVTDTGDTTCRHARSTQA